MVARSTFPSVKAQKYRASGAVLDADIGKVRTVARTTFPSQHVHGSLLEVEMLKKATLLWREAYFDLGMCKAHHVQSTCGNCAFRSQNA